MNFRADLALPKTAGSAQTHKSMSFIELFGALYMYISDFWTKIPKSSHCVLAKIKFLRSLFLLDSKYITWSTIKLLFLWLPNGFKNSGK